MIKEVTMYTVICDNCGKDVCEGSGYACWDDKGYVKDIAIDSGWIKHEDKHYCSNCYEYDDNDELIIKNK